MQTDPRARRACALRRGAAIAALTCAHVALAAPVTFNAGDAGANDASQARNANAAAAAFAAATPNASTITFEGPLPAGVRTSGGSVTNSCVASDAYFGFNTTPGGANVLCLIGGSVTFTFASPISAFGLFVSGLQSVYVANESLTFDDGSAQVIAPVALPNGAAFLGFVDAGRFISSVTYNAMNDIVSIDDVRYVTASRAGVAAVPEPGSVALVFAAAAAALAAARTWRRSARRPTVM